MLTAHDVEAALRALRKRLEFPGQNQRSANSLEGQRSATPNAALGALMSQGTTGQECVGSASQAGREAKAPPEGAASVLDALLDCMDSPDFHVAFTDSCEHLTQVLLQHISSLFTEKAGGAEGGAPDLHLPMLQAVLSLDGAAKTLLLSKDTIDTVAQKVWCSPQLSSLCLSFNAWLARA